MGSVQVLLILDSPRNREWIRQYESNAPGIFADAHFLCIDADFDKQRNRGGQRNTELLQSQTLRYHTDEIFERFKEIPLAYLTTDFKTDFNIQEGKITVIDNKGDKDSFLENISTYAETRLVPSVLRSASAGLQRHMQTQRKKTEELSEDDEEKPKGRGR
jgi:hypothetical protein